MVLRISILSRPQFADDGLVQVVGIPGPDGGNNPDGALGRPKMPGSGQLKTRRKSPVKAI